MRVLGDAIRVAGATGLPHAFMGGIASTALGRPRWTHDIDLCVRPQDARAMLAAFADAGYQTEETDQTWLYKATRDGVLVDLIFESTGGIVLDDEMLSRVRQGSFGHLRLNVLGPEDLLVIKAIVHREHRQRHWFDALALVETGELDWPYLLRRAAPGPRRVASLLLYAQTDGLQVPDWVIEALLEQAREQEAGAGVPDEYLVAHAGEALAADPRTAELELDVSVDGREVHRHRHGGHPRAAGRRRRGRGQGPARPRGPQPDRGRGRGGRAVRGDAAVIRVAAVGDVHVGTDSAGRLAPRLAGLADHADVFLLAGDLTHRGRPEEAKVLAEELRGVRVPIVAVLGNHDYHSDEQDGVTEVLEQAGIRVLEGDAVVLEIGGRRVGIAGSKGFGGGFAGASASDFGEPEMKAFVGHTKALAGRLERALGGLQHRPEDRPAPLLAGGRDPGRGAARDPRLPRQLPAGRGGRPGRGRPGPARPRPPGQPRRHHPRRGAGPQRRRPGDRPRLRGVPLRRRGRLRLISRPAAGR